MHKTARLLATVGAAALATTGLGMMSASAAPATDNMYKTQNANWACVNSSQGGIFCQTDNAGTSVYISDSNTANTRNSIQTTLNNSYNGTDLTISYTTSPVLTGGGETDIIYQSGTLADNVLGSTWCNDAVDSSTVGCDQQYVRFNIEKTIDRMVACHETGHAVGLTHGANAYPALLNNDDRLGCLTTPYDASMYLLGGNNVDNINATYN